VSGFWDAVGRAALGLSATATPRPRSIYEPEAPDSTIDDLIVTNEDAEVSPGTPASLMAPTPAAPTAQAARASDGPANDARSASPHDEREDSGGMVEPSSMEPRAQERASPIVPAREGRADAVPTVSPTVERIEVHRFETTHVVTKSIASEQLNVEPSPATSASTPSRDVSDALESEGHIDSADEGHADVPQSLVAESHIVVTDPAPAASDRLEPSLLIEIDRIDIRIESERVAQPVPERRRDTGTVPSLRDYLARYAEAPR
jgi:hypothetical protein